MSVSEPSPEAWLRAAFLHERKPDSEPCDDARRAEGERWRARWHAQSKAGDELFARRLSDVGLDDDGLRRLLTHPGQPREDAAEWRAFVDDLGRILADGARDAALPEVGRLRTGAWGVPFASLLRPFVSDGLARLREGLSRAGLPPPGAAAAVELLRALCARLQLTVTRALVLELNVARVRGLLAGDSKQARFAFFNERFYEQPGRRLELLQEYQVLARLLVTVVERWVETSLELLQRLHVDRDLLAAAFNGGRAPGALTALEQGLSDPHRRGRGVCRVEFESGLTVMYKPRRLSNDVAFQGLLAWLNEAGLRHPQRTLRVLERGDYGYVEYVHAEPCADVAQLERFYWRQGSLLAVLHLLLATDFHFENLIAAGEHPLLVDLEGLFHPRQEPPDDGTARARARRLLARSVFSVGLLPALVFGRDKRALDLSGLGGSGGQVFPRPMPTLRDADTDEMHVALGDVRLQAGRNRPSLAGQDADPAEWGAALAAGFSETHALLRARREAWQRRLLAFADVEVRYIARPTMRYTHLLQECLHPDYLRDALDRDRQLDRLWGEAARTPALQPLVAAELEDLRLGDVPLFSARPGSRDVWDSRGRRHPDFFPEPGLDAALARSAAFDEAEERRQAEWIAQALVPTTGPSNVSQPDAGRAQGAEPRPDRDAALRAAVRLGAHLAAQAILGERDVTWIGPRLHPGQHWRWEVAPLATGLYEGSAGLTLFFAHLARESGRADFEDLARRGVPTLRAYTERGERPGTPDVSAFSGAAGVAYVLWQLARLWNERELLEAALGVLPRLAEQVPGDVGLDLLGGAAGCAQVALGLHRATGDGAALDVARACGERLLAQARPQERGVGWVSPAARLPLAGFAHGVAGIAWTLLELGAALGDERLRAAALAGLEYERTLFRPERGDWCDRREFAGAAQDFVTVAWCHGAAGVALGRALSLAHCDDPAARDEIRLGVEATLRQGFGGNQSLCHGDLGNADVVRHVAGVVGREDWRDAAERQAARVVGEVLADEWRTGLPRHTTSPGLMTGLAGLGYGLLRLRAPERVPSVLWLEAPRP